VTNADGSPPPGAHLLDDGLVDNSGRPIEAAPIWRTADLETAARAAISRGDAVIAVGARTSATGNFAVDLSRPRPWTTGAARVVGIQAKALATGADGGVLTALADPLGPPDEPIATDQLRVHRHREGPDRHTVTVGAGVTFAQITRALAEVFGADEHCDYCVPVDLTTLDVAHAGAVYATGAQGPSRLRVSDVARSVTLCDGQSRATLTAKDDIARHEGLWGMTGAVCQLELRVFRRPKHRFGFFLPLVRSRSGSWIDQVAAVLAIVRDATEVRLADATLSSRWAQGVVDGAEVVARETVELVAHTPLAAGANRAQAHKVLSLMGDRFKGSHSAIRSDFGVWLTGNSRFAELDAFLDDPDSPLARLVAYADHRDGFLVADGMWTLIDDARALEDMRLLREAFADLARAHARSRGPGQGKPYSESTDVGCFVDPAAAAAMDAATLREHYRLILQPYLAYELRMREFAETARAHGVLVTMTRYGHLNPRATNLHTRVTVHAPADSIHAQVYPQVVQRARERLVAVLGEVAARHPAIRVECGEKGKVTADAWEVMGPDARADVVATLAAADPRWQAQLKGRWAAAVRAARGDGVGSQETA